MPADPVDPQIRAMLDESKLTAAKSAAQIDVAVAREGYRLRYRSRSLPTPAPVQVRDLVAAGVPCRLYRPELAGKLPLIVYFHGGGFVLGDSDAYHFQSSFIAGRTGCMLLFVDFRLAPEHPFPAAVEDALAAISWVRSNLSELDADPAQLVVAGDSAGGNLAVTVCLALRGEAGPPIRLQCLFYPLTDFRPYSGGAGYPSIEAYSKDFGLDREIMLWFRERYLPDPSLARDPRASPILVEDLAGLPEAYVVTPQNDPLRDMAVAFVDRLRGAGVPVTYRCFEGMVHNLLGHAGVSSAAQQALEEVCDFIADRLVDGPLAAKRIGT